MLETGIYVRVSTEEQAQEGYSIRGQEQKLKDYARIKDWSIYNIYSDEGISGKNITERPAISQLVDDIQKGYVKNVLVFKIDRLTRSTADLIYLINLFNQYDCAFNSLSESIDTATPSGRMFIKIIGIFAEFERENIIERTRLGFERKAREGYSLACRIASYGYDRKNGEKIQTINEYEASIVREIFDMFVSKHMTYLDIAKNLNERKVPTKENSIWYSGKIKNVLTNCNHIGMIRYATDDEKRYFEAVGVHEPIIDKELYDEAQRLISKISVKSYTKRPKEEQYFAGVLYCGLCGAKMVSHGDYYTNKEGVQIYSGNYRCYNRTRKKTCQASSIRHSKAESAFEEYIKNIHDFNTIDEIELEETESLKEQRLKLIDSLQKQYDRLEKREKEILAIYVKGDIEFCEYKEVKNSISEEKKRISSELDNVKKTSAIDNKNVTVKSDIIENLKENWCLLDNVEKRQFLVNFIDKIKIVNEMRNYRRGNAKIIDIEFDCR